MLSWHFSAVNVPKHEQIRKIARERWQTLFRTSGRHLCSLRSLSNRGVCGRGRLPTLSSASRRNSAWKNAAPEKACAAPEQDRGQIHIRTGSEHATLVALRHTKLRCQFAGYDANVLAKIAGTEPSSSKERYHQNAIVSRVRRWTTNSSVERRGRLDAGPRKQAPVLLSLHLLCAPHPDENQFRLRDSKLFPGRMPTRFHLDPRCPCVRGLTFLFRAESEIRCIFSVILELVLLRKLHHRDSAKTHTPCV